MGLPQGVEAKGPSAAPISPFSPTFASPRKGGHVLKRVKANTFMVMSKCVALLDICLLLGFDRGNMILKAKVESRSFF